MVADAVTWPEAGSRRAGEAVAAGRADAGVVCCWTGTGVSIAANKVSGVRAALCVDAETARGARRWNDANVFALSLRLTSEEVAHEILDAFFTTGSDDREAATIAQLRLMRRLFPGPGLTDIMTESAELEAIYFRAAGSPRARLQLRDVPRWRRSNSVVASAPLGVPTPTGPPSWPCDRWPT